MPGEWTNLGQNFRAFTARPAKPSTAGVVVIQEIFGVNPHIRAIVSNLARMGYTTIAPDIFHRTGPGFETGYDAKGVAAGRQHKDACTADTLLSDVKSSMDWLKQQGCTRIGCVGFCFGGHAAWLAGTLEGMAACACFYGGGIAINRPGGGQPSITLAPQLKARMVMLYGENDTGIHADEVASVAYALNKAAVRHEVFVFSGAGHGFACDERTDYNAAAANMAWVQVFELLGEELKGQR